MTRPGRDAEPAHIREWLDRYDNYLKHTDTIGASKTMPKWKNNPGGNFEQAPQGTFMARCYRVIDLGTQQPNNPKWKPTRKTLITWELPTELMEDTGEPFSVNSKYTASLNEKAILRRHLESWRGRAFTDEELEGFDPKKILGVPCMINIVHDHVDDKTYANVNGVMAPPKGTAVPPQVNASVFFDMDTEVMTRQEMTAAFNKLSEFWQKQIQGSPEWQELFGGGSGAPAAQPAQQASRGTTGEKPFDDEVNKPFDDDIPF